MAAFFNYRLLFIVVLLLSNIVQAGQYRSRELAPPSQEQIQAAELSISEIENQLPSIDDNYSKASTARFLARHFLQEQNYKKAEDYYQQAMIEDGLSTYAKQDILAELAQLYLHIKNYPAVLESLEQRTQLGGKDDNTLLLIQALAYYHTQAFKQAISAADKVQALEKNPSSATLKQLLFIYFNSQAYAKAASVQQRYVEMHPEAMDAWRNLASIYIKLTNHSRAADTLALAWHKGLAFESRDILLLAELYAISNNPFAAGRLLEHAMQQSKLETSISSLEKQFRYWLLAREQDKAIQSLEQMVKIQPDVERYLQLAQLQSENEQWLPAKSSVLQACQLSLADQYVGKANLLLGISEWNLDNPAAARSAFINATLIGGVNEQANSWLRYIQAEPSSDKEQQAFNGPCTPKWARTTSRQLAIATGKSQESQEESIQYSIKTSAPQTLFVGSYTLAVKLLENRIRPLAMQLGMAIAKNRGSISGPMHFIFNKPIQPEDEVIEFQMAFPISRAPDVTGRYKVVDDPGYNHASTIFDDHPEQLGNAWKKLYEKVIADGHELSGSGRQIVLEPGKETIKMELQLGIIKEK